MSYLNKHLIEVICGFQFFQDPVTWDSTYYGQFYERIKAHGFTEKQERKGFQIEVNANPDDVSKTIFTAGQAADDLVIFKNLEKGWAIMMGKKKVSFHILSNYSKWESFRDDLITPYLKYYTDLNLGVGPKQCTMMYLNRFTKPVTDNLSDYFSVISNLKVDTGIESNTFVQRVFSTKKSVLIAKLSSQLQEDESNVINLECGATCMDQELINAQEDFILQANETHAPVKNFFESIITQKLRSEL